MRVRVPRWVLLAVGVAGVLAAASQAPRLLRRIDAFRVRRVEILGTRYLAPHEVLERSGIARGASVFDDFAPWIAALRAHPVIADVRIARDLPGTLLVQVTEVEPVALARTPELRPVDAEARVLPIDPALADLDLPVLAIASAVGADGRLGDRRAVALVAALSQIQRHEPALARRISEAGAAEGGLRLLLREPAEAEALLPGEPGALRLEQLRLALADLSARSELPRLRRIDVRFRDQVVVSLTPSTRS